MKINCKIKKISMGEEINKPILKEAKEYEKDLKIGDYILGDSYGILEVVEDLEECEIRIWEIIFESVNNNTFDMNNFYINKEANGNWNCEIGGDYNFEIMELVR